MIYKGWKTSTHGSCPHQSKSREGWWTTSMGNWPSIIQENHVIFFFFPNSHILLLLPQLPFFPNSHILLLLPLLPMFPSPLLFHHHHASSTLNYATSLTPFSPTPSPSQHSMCFSWCWASSGSALQQRWAKLQWLYVKVRATMDGRRDDGGACGSCSLSFFFLYFFWLLDVEIGFVLCCFSDLWI